MSVYYPLGFAGGARRVENVSGLVTGKSLGAIIPGGFLRKVMNDGVG